MKLDKITTVLLLRKAKIYNIPSYTKMGKEGLLEAVYPSVSTQTEGAFFSRELRKFSDQEQMNRLVDDICWRGICKNLQKTNDDLRICLDCGDTKDL